MRFYITFFFIILFAFQFCKKAKETRLETIRGDKNISDEIALVENSKIIFGDQFKEIKLEKINDSYKVSIDFGGSSALTFHKKDIYLKDMKLTTAKRALSYFYYSKNRKLDTLILSLIKPYYVIEPTVKKEMVEDFEVYRVSIKKVDIEKIIDWEARTALLLSGVSKNNDENIILEEMQKNWIVELDEFYRVEVK